ncbi:Hua1p [Lachancea thermotolerans CBS 6340]|uniref:KLTH0B09086p n=1 Tax=Lachancea thermotolerans (strain ATCC 56472 / CBS 6340 / NRRL Y-8284) TaxID=559295 RepID=C5DD82_LACTC|nr:KLTH0B09086p [Lachancea thermotolerans CBS 6340]CAR21743.1 KLTH0B09086p [Lachancea thermotolerans CBS 6340]
MVHNEDPPPPSYDEAIKESALPFGPEERPPAMPARPSTYTHRPPARPPRPVSSAGPSGPSAYGASSPGPSAASSSSFQSYGGSSYTAPAASQSTRPSLPWTYPRGYYCTKCGNTGYKIKNGHSCKRCWRKFAHSSPSQNVQVTYGGYAPSYALYGGAPTFGTVPMAMGVSPASPAPASGGAPLVLRPGDPRIGGVTCGECRGSGRVRFLLDKEICPLCHGVGRVL